MLSWLKDHLIPHHGNEHHPHILRTEAIVFLLAVMITAESMFLVSAFHLIPEVGLFSAILPNVLVQSTNASRADLGLSGLTTNPTLERAAQMKANDMATKSYFAHTSPEGITPWYWLKQVDYSYLVAGENLAVNFIDSADVHSAWMNSPSHKANIIEKGYTQIGIATAKGIYKGAESIFVVQYFGLPATAPVSQPRIVFAPQQVAAATTNIPEPQPARPAPSGIPALAVAHQAPRPSIIETVVASPRTNTNRILLIIGGLVIFSLLLTMVVRYELPHPRMVLAPMVLIFVMLSAIAINRYVGLLHSAV